MRYLITYTRTKLNGASETRTEVITEDPMEWWDSSEWTNWGEWDECVVLMVYREGS